MSFVTYLFISVSTSVDQYSLALVRVIELGTGVNEQDLNLKIYQNVTPANFAENLGFSLHGWKNYRE